MSFNLSKILMGIILLVINSSCKRNDSDSQNLKQQLDIKKHKNEIVEFEFDFPDTVHKNKPYDGKIIYRSVLDTVTTAFNNEKSGKSRYILYSLTKVKNINYNEDYLRTIAIDTFGATNNREIPFYDIKFDQTGIYYIDGIINDNVIIDIPNKEKKQKEDKVRYIVNEVRATHKVIVIE